MERTVFIFVLMALFVMEVSAQTRKPIFRSIDVSTTDKKRSIELGGDLARNVDILIKTGDAFVLNGNFGNTERIAAFVNNAGKVDRIIFDYGSSRDFKKLTDGYVKDFGAPTIKESLSSAIFNARMVAWDDGKTRFEIVERIENGQVRISSVMIDKHTSSTR
jgi:hypothetical protein